jgi:hypothetical protein
MSVALMALANLSGLPSLLFTLPIQVYQQIFRSLLYTPDRDLQAVINHRRKILVYIYEKVKGCHSGGHSYCLYLN